MVIVVKEEKQLLEQLLQATRDLAAGKKPAVPKK